MKRVFRIAVSDSAPRVEFSPDEPYYEGLRELNGKSISGLVPADDAFRGTLTEHGEWNQFYNVAPGAFAVSEEAWDRCMDLYYLLEYGDIEIPWIVTRECALRLVNPLQVLPSISSSTLGQANKIFRIGERPTSELFCLEGTSVHADEFKYIYDHFGFQGLEFTEIWHEEGKAD
jgi:hypothetical protein